MGKKAGECLGFADPNANLIGIKQRFECRDNAGYQWISGVKYQSLHLITLDDDFSAQTENLSDESLDAIARNRFDCQLKWLRNAMRILIVKSG